MTDTPPDKPVAFSAVTLDAFMELVERVGELEGTVPATVPDDGIDPATADAINARLDRHRADIEDIKTRWNALMRYLGLQAPPTSPAEPAPTPRSYQ